MKYAYFPGCSLHSTAREYDMSAREVAGALGIELLEIPDWICCGSTPAHLTDQILSLALPVKNLLQAKAMGEEYEVVTCCAACFSRFKIANHTMQNNAELREKVEKTTGQPYEGDIKVRHFIDVLVNIVGLEKIKEHVTNQLNGLKVACYYGCLLTRPSIITDLDDLEDPMLMDDIMRAIGAEPVQWPYKTECCGASFSLSKTDIVLKLSGDILQMALDEGAQALAVACPLCQSNLDLRQSMINKKNHKDFHMPVLYFTQLIGLSLGIEPKKLGLGKHIVDPLPLLREKDILVNH